MVNFKSMEKEIYLGLLYIILQEAMFQNRANTTFSREYWALEHFTQYCKQTHFMSSILALRFVKVACYAIHALVAAKIIHALMIIVVTLAIQIVRIPLLQHLPLFNRGCIIRKWLMVEPSAVHRLPHRHLPLHKGEVVLLTETLD